MQLVDTHKTFGNLCIKGDLDHKVRNVHLNAFMFTSQNASEGKDYCADRLMEILTKKEDQVTVAYKFATPLLNAYASVFGCQSQNFHKQFVDRRPKLIKFSKACKEILDTIWIDRTCSSIDQDVKDFLISSDKHALNLVFSDLRYEYEFEAIRYLFACLKESQRHITATNIQTLKVTGNSKVTKINDRDEVGKFFDCKHSIIIENNKTGPAPIQEQLAKKLFLW